MSLPLVSLWANFVGALLIHSRETAERQPRGSRETTERQPRDNAAEIPAGRQPRDSDDRAAERQPRDSHDRAEL